MCDITKKAGDEPALRITRYFYSRLYDKLTLADKTY
jgi:hypothetical protein